MKLHKSGVPMDKNDWTVKDWRDLYVAIQDAIAKISARHKPAALRDIAGEEGK